MGGRAASVFFFDMEWPPWCFGTYFFTLGFPNSVLGSTCVFLVFTWAVASPKMRARVCARSIFGVFELKWPLWLFDNLKFALGYPHSVLGVNMRFWLFCQFGCCQRKVARARIRACAAPRLFSKRDCRFGCLDTFLYIRFPHSVWGPRCVALVFQFAFSPNITPRGPHDPLKSPVRGPTMTQHSPTMTPIPSERAP